MRIYLVIGIMKLFRFKSASCAALIIESETIFPVIAVVLADPVALSYRLFFKIVLLNLAGAPYGTAKTVHGREVRIFRERKAIQHILQPFQYRKTVCCKQSSSLLTLRYLFQKTVPVEIDENILRIKTFKQILQKIISAVICKTCCGGVDHFSDSEGL